MLRRFCLLAACLAVCDPGLAQVLGRKTDQTISDIGFVGFLSLEALLPLVEDGRAGANHTLRTIDSFTSALVVEQAFKATIRERRPDGSGRDSFPSGHAVESFAIATMESQYHPGQAVFWYGGAALISAARLDLNKHRLHDVLFGAA